MEAKDVSSLKNTSKDGQEGMTTSVMNNGSVGPQDFPTLFRPSARVTALNLYEDRNGLIGQPLRQHGSIDSIYGKWAVPHHCGYDYCTNEGNEKAESSLLGPEFVEYADPEFFPSFQLAALATDMSKIAWMRSGLDRSIAPKIGASPEAVGRAVSLASRTENGILHDTRMNNRHFCFDKWRSKLIGTYAVATAPSK